MRVEKTPQTYMPFKDYFKKQQEKKKQQKEKKTVEPSKDKKDGNFIGWA